MRSRTPATLLLLLLVAVAPISAQYRTAVAGYRYQFPRDHFNHPDYQTEWWYYTGNLKAADGHRFGFELTFFRQGVSRERSQATAWDIRDIYLAHLALSDLDGGHFYHTERVNRAGPGLAGASEQAEKVWNGNWQVQWTNDQQLLQAISTDFDLRFVMRSTKSPVIHGKNGISQKAGGSGEASQYISFTRLLTKGSVLLQGKLYQVEGTSWMDHEFFTTPPTAEQTGWDWVSLQLDDRTELMLYRFRHKDGSVDPFSAGTYIDEKGTSTFLSSADFSMNPGSEKYVSAKTNTTYPIAWKIRVPSLQLDIGITTSLPSQELVSGIGTALSYWEGAISITGTRDGRTATGVGYLEMTSPGRQVQSHSYD